MRLSWISVLFVSTLFFAGCSGMPDVTPTDQPSSAAGAVIKGSVHGGQNPIVGAHVYLLAVNSSATSTYGGPGIAASSTNASASVLTSGAGSDSLGTYVTTDSNGNFTITGDYTCPSSYTHPYLYATGGNAGGGSNSAISLVGAVSSCDSSEFVIINEVSTVIAAYAFAGFTTDPTHVSATNTAAALTALNNATNAIENLLNPSTSTPYATTPAGNGTVPQAEIDTLANILAACVNSTGSSSTQCSTLFSNAMNGSTAPTDTATAIVNISHNPGVNIANLYALQTASSPFVPMLSAAPTDFALPVVYTGGGLSEPTHIAIDSFGNVWVTNGGNDNISSFSPAGAATSGSGGFSSTSAGSPQSIAIDGQANIWVVYSIYPTYSLSEFSVTGTVESPSGGYIGGGLSTPRMVAVDKSGNIWVANEANSLTEYNPTSNTFPSGSGGFTGSGKLNQPYGLAVDTSGNLWVTDEGGYNISEFSTSNGAENASSPFSGGGLDTPEGVAVGASGDIWVNDLTYGSNVAEFSSSGSAISLTNGYSVIGSGTDIAVDGAGDVWTSSSGKTCSIHELTPSGKSVVPTGYYGANPVYSGSSTCAGVAVDSAGNVWVPNLTQSSVTEFVGVAVPVVTPIVANLLSPYGSSAVNRP